MSPRRLDRDRCHRAPPRIGVVDRAWRAGNGRASVEACVFGPAGLRILPCRDAYERLPRPGQRRDTPRVGGAASEVFVGRVREFGRLERALDATRAGNGTTALVTGEAGIGKSRLTSELAARARGAGMEVLLGRSIDLVGTELPYQPFVEALRPLGGLAPIDGQAAGSQLRVFEQTLAVLTDRAATASVLLVLEDLHWADTSTVDLVAFLAHNLTDGRVLLLATYRADEPASAERLRRLTDGVRRSGTAVMVELGPLTRADLTALLAARTETPLPSALMDAIVARAEGNPFFAEELLAVADDRSGELPHGLRHVLLQRVAGLDPSTRGLLRLAAAAPAELAPHWAAAGRMREALAASVEAARQAEAVFGRPEALAHLERALALWPAGPDAAHLGQADLAELCSRTAELAWHTGAPPRAVELAQQANEL